MLFISLHLTYVTHLIGCGVLPNGRYHNCGNRATLNFCLVEANFGSPFPDSFNRFFCFCRCQFLAARKRIVWKLRNSFWYHHPFQSVEIGKIESERAVTGYPSISEGITMDDGCSLCCARNQCTQANDEHCQCLPLSHNTSPSLYYPIMLHVLKFYQCYISQLFCQRGAFAGVSTFREQIEIFPSIRKKRRSFHQFS